VDIKLQTFGFRENLPTESIVQVYRIIQEALHNIVRHSRASRADIQFFGYDTQLVLTIEDNGIGFDPAAESGFGLNSLKARAALLEGKIEINSSVGNGCLIVIEIPIPSPVRQ
jgi:signal transduction histidine kinase